jgi:hypothetical protein
LSRQKVGIKGFADMMVEGIFPQIVLDEIDELIDFSIFSDAFNGSLSAFDDVEGSFDPDTL